MSMKAHLSEDSRAGDAPWPRAAAVNTAALGGGNAGEEPSQVWLTPDQAAAYLYVSRSTIYVLIQKGRLPAVHVGRSLRIKREVLEDLASSGALRL